ncbi:MAG: flavin reductase family protein [Bacteroidales bacterium]|nr:flavin reductase family protein [Bacteroidales bacterium]
MNNNRVSKKDIGAMSTLFPAPILVVGSYNADGTPNIMTVSFAGIISMQPPTLYVSLRKATLTYENVVREGAFTVNVPNDKYIKETDFIGLNSGKKVRKFDVTGLIPVKSEIINAPYVHEFPVIYECRVTQSLEIGSHTQFIAEILNIKANENILDEKGKPDIEKISPIMMGSSQNTNFYYGLGEELEKGFVFKKKFLTEE